jgi:putative heme iron utilization protein
MLETTSRPYGHDAPNETFATPQALVEVPTARERTAAEEARTLAAGSAHAALATISEGGDPWASMVAYALMPSGDPVLCVSTLAEHGRNLKRELRASLMIAQPEVAGDPLANGRVTLAGVAEPVEGEAEEEARAAYVAKIPAAGMYAGFGDFSIYVLKVERVRWVGGYGRMDSADADSYRAAEADPVAPAAASTVRDLNERAEELQAIAAQLGGHPDVTATRATGIDRYGLFLDVKTPRGRGPARVGFAEPVDSAEGLSDAIAELTLRAQSTS